MFVLDRLAVPPRVLETKVDLSIHGARGRGSRRFLNEVADVHYVFADSVRSCGCCKSVFLPDIAFMLSRKR